MTRTSHSYKLAVKSIDDSPKGSVVRAVIMAPVTDLQGEVIDTRSLILPLKGGGTVRGYELTRDHKLNITLVTNHDLKDGRMNRDVRQIIGSVTCGELNEFDELVVDISFSSIAIAQDMYTLVKEGHLDDVFSIVAWHNGPDSDGIIRNAEPIQLGLVWKSANQRARVLAKALGEGATVTKVDVNAKKELLAAKQAEVESLESEISEAEAEEQEVVKSAEEIEAEQKAADDAAAEKAKADQEAADAKAAEEAAEEDKRKAEEEAEAARKKEEEDNVSTTQKELAAKAAAAKVNEEARQAETVVDDTKRRALAVKGLTALRNRDSGEVARINKELEKTATADIKQIAAKAAEDGRAGYGDVSGEGTATSFLQAELDATAAKLYEGVGGIVAKVTKKTLTGNSTEYRKRIKRERLQYAPAPYGKNKKVQHLLPAWFNAKVQPWAVIAAWDEELAEDAPYDFFNEVTEDLFDGALWNEEFMILGFAGGTFGGRVYEATGILPILKTAGDRYAQYTVDSTFPKVLATAIGNIISTQRNPQITLAMTRTTRAQLAGIQDADGNLLFTGNGQTLDLGLLGTVSIEEVDERNVPNGQILVGDMSQYIDLEKGGVKILGSQHASLDGVSLYQSDGEALRARQRIGGGPLFPEAFYVLGTQTVASGVALPAQPTADVVV